MWNPPGSNPSLQQQQHQPRGAALHNQISSFTPSSPQPPSPSSYTSGRRGVVGGAGSDVSRTPPSSTTSTTTAATTSPQWRASATDRPPHISSPTGNLPSGTGFTGNVHTDPVQPIPSAGSPRSTSPQEGGGDGGDTRSSTSRSRGFNRLFSALDDAAQSIPRGSPVAAMTSSSSSSDDDGSDSSSSSSRSLSGGSMPHAPDDIMSSHASQRGGGSIQNDSIFSGVSMPTSGGATMPAIKEPTDLLSKFASRMVSNQWRAQTASTLGAGVVVGGGSGGGVTKTSSMTSPRETTTTEAAQSKVATSPGVSGRGAIVFTDSPHPHSNTTSYAHKVGDYNLNDSGGAAATSSSGRREYGFGMDGFGDGGSGRGGVLGSVGDLGCSSRSDHDDNASVQHSTFTLNSQLTGGGPSLMHSAMGSVHTVSTSAGGLNSMHSNASKGSRPWTMMMHNGTDDIMTNAFGAKMQRNALLYAIVDENVRTQSRSDPLNTGSMTPGRAGGSGLGSSAEHHNSNHWSPPASMSFGSPPACPADVLQHHSNQQLHPTNTNNLSTTASPDAKLARPVPTKGVQFQSYTEPTTTDANSNNTNQQQNGYSMASLSHTAPLPAKKDRSPDGIMNEGNDNDGNGGLHPHSGGGLDNSVMTSFVSGREAAPIESPPVLVPTPPRGPNHSRSLSASRDSDDVERCEVTGERRADLPPAPPQGVRKGVPPGRPEPLQHPVNTVIPHAPRMIKVPDEDGRNKRKLLRYRPAPRSGPASLAKFIDSDTVSDETAKAQSEFQEAIAAHQCWPGSGHQDAPQQGLKFGSSNDTTQLDHTFTTFNTQGGGGTTTRNGPTSCETTFVSFGTRLLSRSPQSGSGRPAVSLLGGGSSGGGSGRNRLGFDLEDSNMGGTMTTFGTTALPAPRAQIQHHHNHTMGGGGLHHHHRQDDRGVGNSLSNGDLSSMGVGGEEDGSEEGVMGGWGDEGGALPIPSSRNPMVMHHHNGAPLSPSSNATNATTFGTDPNNTKSDPTRSGGGATGSDDLIRGGGATGVRNIPGVVSLPQTATKNSSSKRRTHSSLSDEDLEMNSESGGVGVLGDFASLPVPVKGIDSPTENFPLETVPAPAPRRLNAPWTKVNVEGRTSASAKATPPPPPTATTTAQPSYRVGGML